LESRNGNWGEFAVPNNLPVERGKVASAFIPWTSLSVVCRRYGVALRWLWQLSPPRNPTSQV
jgi:hypothetical protein